MDMLTITALLYVSCFAFFHANKKRTAFAAVKASLALQRGMWAFGWGTALVACVLIVSRKGAEVGIPLWIGAFVLAAIISLFTEALWQRVHLPLAGLSLAIFAAGLFAVSWGMGPL